MVLYCAVYGCLQNTKNKNGRRFFCFPLNAERCRYWIKAINRKELENKSLDTLHSFYRVCDLHFPESDLCKRRLRPDAVPTLRLPQLENSLGTTKYTQTDITLLSTSEPEQTNKSLPGNTHRKRKLNTELNTEIKKRQLLESINKNGTNANGSDMPSLQKKFIEAHKMLKNQNQGNKYDKKYATFALNLYYTSPVAYSILSESLCLPNIRTLQRGAAFNISTKFDENIIKFLQCKSRMMLESEKYCIICADEMVLKRHLHYQIDKDKVIGFHEINNKQSKEIATQAFVVMARGIFSNWEQPLAFCFLSQSKNCEELVMWLENIIAKMIEIGFNVCAFTSNQGSTFVNVAQNKSVTPCHPFFKVNGKKIYYIFDVPHLTKSLRDTLINYDFVYDDDDDGSQQVASWSDIEQMYEIEKNKNYKMAYKLTEAHIRPNSFEKMHVKFATQALSRTVAVTMSTLIESGKLEERCMGTVKFVELVNDIFDILNSSTVNEDYKYKKAFYHAEHQTKTLKKAQHILSVLRIINRDNGKAMTEKTKFVKGFLISIRAILSLASDLKNTGFVYLFTQKLNQEPLENFFEKIWQQAGICQKPSAIQFLTAFKKLFMVKIIRHSEYANCADDLDQLLIKLQQTQSSIRIEEDNISTESKEIALKVDTYDYRFDLPENNAFDYVCGYLAKKCYDRHKGCEVMEKYIRSNEEVDENNVFTYCKTNRGDSSLGVLINPPDDFKQYVKQIDSVFKDHFTNCDFYHVGNEILTKLSNIIFDLPCPCFPLEFLKKLFLRFRICSVMRHNNKNFKSYKSKNFSISHL